MTAPRPRVARKVLIASMGVATMTYVISCGSSGTTGHGDGGPDAKADARDEFPVGNLAPRDAGPTDHAAPTDHATIDEFPVANLVVSPDH